MSEDKIQLEAQLFSTQLLFQYLFSQEDYKMHVNIF